MLQVVSQPLPQTLLAIKHTLATILQQPRHLTIVRFLKQQRPARERLERPMVRLTANPTIDDDPRPPEQLPILVPKNAGRDSNAIPTRRFDDPSQPGKPLTLHRRVKVADEQHVDIALSFFSPLSPP